MFLVLEGPTVDIILEHPWLSTLQMSDGNIVK